MAGISNELCDQLMGLISEIKYQKAGENSQNPNKATRRRGKSPGKKLEIGLDSSDSSDDNAEKQLNTQFAVEKKKLNKAKNPFWRPNINVTGSNLGRDPMGNLGMFLQGRSRNRKRDESDRESCSSEQGLGSHTGARCMTTRPSSVQEKFRCASLTDVSNLKQKGHGSYNANSMTSQNYNRYLPFYYVVPENPTETNPLPPGKYLVIPQGKICNFPLPICHHPKGAKGSSPASAGHERSTSKVRNAKQIAQDQNPIKDKDNSDKVKQEGSENKKKKSKEKVGGEAGEGKGQSRDDGENFISDLPSVINLSYHEDGERDYEAAASSSRDCQDDFSTVLELLPFYDWDILTNLWWQKPKETNVATFVQEMQDRRSDEVRKKILHACPHIDLDYLENKIPEIFGDDDLVDNFILSENKNNVLVRLMGDFDIDLPEVVELYEFYHGDENLIRNHMAKLREKEAENERAEFLFAQICAILPDIDPLYISEKLRSITDDPESVNNLVAELLESEGYPKLTEVDPKIRERRKWWKYYMLDFSVPNYLEKVPDPMGTFCGTNLKSSAMYREAALKFLENRYPDLDAFQLEHVFDEQKHSISETCSLLDKNYLPVKNIGSSLVEYNFDEAFVQEASFAAHRKMIVNYIEDERERREVEKRRAEEEKSFLECLLCYDQEVVGLDAVTCPEGHIVCRGCFITYVQTTFADGIYKFNCLNESCDTEYTTKTLEKHLRPSLFSKVLLRRAATEIDQAGVSGLEKCPSCDYAYIPAPEDKIFKCENEECLRETCRLCKEKNHIPLSCDEVERPRDLLARQEIEEAMTNKLVRNCSRCGKRYVKLDGCNKIACSCGALLCYICSAVVNDYTHFNGQGGMELWKCPLYSNNEKLHVEDVKEAGLRTKEKLLRENPDINLIHDPTEL